MSPTKFIRRLRKQPDRLSKEFRRWRAHGALQKLGVSAYIDGYPADAKPPHTDELLGLYCAVMQRRPARILELGGGYSTFVLAQAVRKLTQRGHAIEFWSVDESDHWQKVQKDHIPKHLMPFISFYRSNPRLMEMDGETVSIFDSLPVESCNFVYVDGGLVEGNAIGADTLLLERSAPADYTIQVDGRTPTVEFLRRKLAHQYAIRPGLSGVQSMFVRMA